MVFRSLLLLPSEAVAVAAASSSMSGANLFHVLFVWARSEMAFRATSSPSSSMDSLDSMSPSSSVIVDVVVGDADAINLCVVAI